MSASTAICQEVGKTAGGLAVTRCDETVAARFAHPHEFGCRKCGELEPKHLHVNPQSKEVRRDAGAPPPPKEWPPDNRCSRIGSECRSRCERCAECGTHVVNGEPWPHELGCPYRRDAEIDGPLKPSGYRPMSLVARCAAERASHDKHALEVAGERVRFVVRRGPAHVDREHADVQAAIKDALSAGACAVWHVRWIPDRGEAAADARKVIAKRIYWCEPPRGLRVYQECVGYANTAATAVSCPPTSREDLVRSWAGRDLAIETLILEMP